MNGPDPKPWHEEGQRLAQELNLLRQRGYEPGARRVVAGQLMLDAEVRYQGRPAAVQIVFAAEYPYIAPTVISATIQLDRHQRPDDDNFCLDREDSPWWRPWKSAADALDHLQSLLDADEAGGVREGEADMPEPITGMIRFHPEAVVVVPAPLLALTLDRGEGRLQIACSPRNPQLLAAEGVVDPDGSVVKLIDGKTLARLGVMGAVQRLSVPWRAVELPAGRLGPGRATDEILRTLEPAARAAVVKRPRRNVQTRTVWGAITFLQEGPRRGEKERTWLFARQKVPVRGERRVTSTALFESQALSADVRRLRTQELAGLERARVLVVGAGSLGGHVALELARAGVGKLDIVDGDRYDLNNGVRHVLPAAYAGQEKAIAVAAFARASSPFTDARGHTLIVGGTSNAQREILSLIHAASVVVDATGSETVTRLLHHRCAQAAVPLVTGALSAGGLGGRIVVLREHSPCLDCFYESNEVPARDAARTSGTTPYGCSHPAASCAPFEVTELAANIARTAVRCVPRLAYGSLDFDWAVINFRRGADRWTQGLLAPLLDCEGCGATAADFPMIAA
jgi:molybdopterin/thiamine biosynthesis adenylyltransferase